MRKNFAALLVCLVIFLPIACLGGSISSQLQDQIENSKPGQMHKVILSLTEQADIYILDQQLKNQKATLAERNYQVIIALQDIATRTQPPVLAKIDNFTTNNQVKNVRSFWLANLIAIEATESAINALTQINAVAKISLDYPIELIEPIENSKPVEPGNVIASVEQGLIAIHAPEAWALGFTGAGRLVSNLDTGVEGTHPALAARFRGDVDGDSDYDESWHDPYDTGWTFPQDSGTHGTHTMGTICGRTPDGDTIGVAIDAQWIASACIDRGGGIDRTIADALLAFQWIADPDNDPLTQDNPDACGNSWGIPDGYLPDCDETFWVAIDNVEAAGTVVIFSAGNEGSSGLRSPSDRATTHYNCFSVGAIDGNDPSYPIAYFSALGPTECVSGNLSIKPEVVAPGVDVRSSVPGGSYGLKSGTSMASPHVTGAVAVIRQANPNLDANTIKEILMTTAEDLPLSSPDGEDNTFGHGNINLYQAVLYAQGFGNVDGYITDASTSAPIPGKVSVVGLQVETHANPAGYYIFGLPADTTITLEASYFGYLSQQQSVYVIGDDTVAQDFSLIQAPTATLEGTVISTAGDSIADAEVTILNTPIPPETTDVSGFYQFSAIPSGSSYEVRVKAIGYSQGSDNIFILDGVANILNFSLWPAESFENNNGGYSGAGEWEWGEPTYGPSSAWSGTKAWGTDLDDIYNDNADDNLISTQSYLSSPDARLEFYHWYDIESSYDGGNVAISINGGSDWTVINPDGGYPDADISAFDNLEPGYTGSSGGWTVASFDLSAYNSQNVMFRWRFGTDGSVTGAGWYIDDVVIIGATPPEPPDMSYSPFNFNVSSAPGNVEIRDIDIVNDGDGPLHFTLSSEMFNQLNRSEVVEIPLIIERQMPDPIGYHPASSKAGSKPEPYYPPVITDQGGPDTYGYTWIDSDEPGGPTYSWVDITSIGTLIEGLGDDTNVGPFPVGFNFNFYGNDFSTFYFCTNGFASFTSTSNVFSNAIIPTGSQPFNLLAPLWDDINFNDGGTAYYYTNNSDSLVISWIEVAHYGGSGPYTFQIILRSNGKVTYQYQTINAPDNEATIGIQNGDGSDGLQVVYNAAYVHNSLAIDFAADPIWLTVSPASDVVPPYDSYTATARFDATDLPIGVYTGNINLLSNDPVQPDVDIPVTFNVGSGGTPDIVLDPTSISAILSPYVQQTYDIMIHNNGDGTLSATFNNNDSWIEFDAGPYFVAPNDSVTFEVTLNTDGIAPGAYNAFIGFTSNDPDTPSGSIPVGLEVLTPDISYSPTSVTDSLAGNSQAAHQVWFYNDGDGILATQFSTGTAWIDLDIAPVLIDPADSGMLQITLNSGSLTPGTYNGSVDFTSNDPDTPSGGIPVEMYIYEPNIDIDPSAIGDTLESDQQSTKFVHINNTGAGILDYSVTYQTFNSFVSRIGLVSPDIPVRSMMAPEPFTVYSGNDIDKKAKNIEPFNPPVITDQGGPDAFGYWWIDSNEPDGPTYSWIDITSVGTPITALEDDDNSGPYAMNFNFSFYDNIYSSFRFCTNGFISFTSTANNYTNNPIPTSGAEPLNLIAPFWDDMNFTLGGSAYYYTNNSDSLVISWVDVPHYSSGGPYTYQMILLANGHIIFQYLNITDPNNSATVGIQNIDGTIGLQVVFDAVYVENDLAVEIYSGSWLSVTPTGGSVDPYERDSLEVGFDASGLGDGGYLGQISIASNDPDTPLIDIPVNLDVGLQPMPIISLNVSSIVDTVFSGYTGEFELLVSNIGTIDLNYALSDNRSWITESPEGGLAGPGVTDTIAVIFDASMLPEGTYTGTVTIDSDDPMNPQINLPVQLTVVTAAIPDIDISPTAFTETVVEGSIIYADLIIGNEGSGTLSYNLSDNRTWLSESPENGEVAEAEAPDTITVTFDASGLTQGTYGGIINVASNDPDEGSIDISVVLNVVIQSSCDYIPGDINNDGLVIGSDVTYGVRYFASGPPPPDSCELGDATWLYVAGDVNGSCTFIGSDITRMVNYFRGDVEVLDWCAEVPPANPPVSADLDKLEPSQILIAPGYEDNKKTVIRDK
ncbi:MAG: S8 family serine peptidase [candidate division Zixibacteria bacterium]|nr:S8 family serine peptidase [candidate division Zixibacteria bacterium]